MHLLSSEKKINSSKLFFSKNELSRILSCYSFGVSRGDWKDYAINFKKNEAIFFIFKHTLASPDCILTKLIKPRKNKIFFELIIKNKKKKNFNDLDDLLILLKRKNFNVL